MPSELLIIKNRKLEQVKTYEVFNNLPKWHCESEREVTSLKWISILKRLYLLQTLNIYNQYTLILW